ncbi:MAG: SsrA-binding protein SmpB [Candidatus Krumholzibacteriia bacterium]|nr:SsrA-binding protein SmpB [bacterium]
MSEGLKIIAVNRKARFNYELLETLEAGMVLVGTEVKSLREGKVNIKDAYAEIVGGELWLVGLHISPYEQGTTGAHEPERRRKLLVNGRELRRLATKVQEKGLTLVPTRLYFKAGWAKVELALGRGKRQYDKRQTIAKRDADRAVARARRGDRE